MALCKILCLFLTLLYFGNVIKCENPKSEEIKNKYLETINHDGYNSTHIKENNEITTLKTISIHSEEDLTTTQKYADSNSSLTVEKTAYLAKITPPNNKFHTKKDYREIKTTTEGWITADDNVDVIEGSGSGFGHLNGEDGFVTTLFGDNEDLTNVTIEDIFNDPSFNIKYPQRAATPSNAPKNDIIERWLRENQSSPLSTTHKHDFSTIPPLTAHDTNLTAVSNEFRSVPNQKFDTGNNKSFPVEDENMQFETSPGTEGSFISVPSSAPSINIDVLSSNSRDALIFGSHEPIRENKIKNIRSGEKYNFDSILWKNPVEQITSDGGTSHQVMLENESLENDNYENAVTTRRAIDVEENKSSLLPRYYTKICMRNETVCVSLNTTIQIYFNETKLNLPLNLSINASNLEYGNIAFKWTNVEKQYNISLVFKVSHQDDYYFVDEVHMKILKYKGAFYERPLTEESLIVRKTGLNMFVSEMGETYIDDVVNIIKMGHGVEIKLSNMEFSVFEGVNTIEPKGSSKCPLADYYVEMIVGTISIVVIGGVALYVFRKLRKDQTKHSISFPN